MKQDPIIRFLEYAEAETKKHGVKLVLEPGPCIDDGTFQYSGYFDESVVTFAVGNPYWINVAAHEFSHFNQWRSKRCKPWNDLYINGRDKPDACALVGSWLEGEIEITKPTLKNLIRRIQLMELDCEKRAVKLIQKFKLPVDMDFHMRGAAAYMHFHNCMRETRKWVKNGYKLWLDQDLLKMVRPSLDYSFSRTSPRVMEYMKTNCV